MKFDEKDDRYKRNRERELERDLEEEERNSGLKPLNPAQKGAGPESLDSVMEKIRIADVMIDQIHNLYQMYFSGVERQPPFEKQKTLEKAIQDLQNNIMQTPAGRFRFNTLHARFLSYKDRWGKMVKDLENGKIKRAM